MKVKNKDTQRWWDEYAEKFNLEQDPFELNEARKVEWQIIYKCFSISPAKFPRLAELGCGTGHFTLNFLKKGFRVTGIDVSQKSLAILKKRAQRYDLASKFTPLYHGLFKSLPKLKESFDAGYMISTYHCLSNKKEEQAIVLENFIKLIKKGGKILIMEPNPLNPLFYFFYPSTYRWNWREGFNIINSRLDLLRENLKAMGMKNIRVFYHSFLPTSLINEWKGIKKINDFLCSLPLIKNFSAFHIITAVKRS